MKNVVMFILIIMANTTVLISSAQHFSLSKDNASFVDEHERINLYKTIWKDAEVNGILRNKDLYYKMTPHTKYVKIFKGFVENVDSVKVDIFNMDNVSVVNYPHYILYNEINNDVDLFAEMHITMDGKSHIYPYLYLVGNKQESILHIMNSILIEIGKRNWDTHNITIFTLGSLDKLFIKYFEELYVADENKIVKANALIEDILRTNKYLLETYEQYIERFPEKDPEYFEVFRLNND